VPRVSAFAAAGRYGETSTKLAPVAGASEVGPRCNPLRILAIALKLADLQSVFGFWRDLANKTGGNTGIFQRLEHRVGPVRVDGEEEAA
jgi:hypothetical protein